MGPLLVTADIENQVQRGIYKELPRRLPKSKDFCFDYRGVMGSLICDSGPIEATDVARYTLLAMASLG
jgi:hypothetical protein